MRISNDNAIYRIFDYYVREGKYRSLRSILEVVIEEYLLRIYPQDLDQTRRGYWTWHQWEYLDYELVEGGGVSWTKPGLHPVVTSNLGGITSVILEVGELWIREHLPGMLKAMRLLTRRDIGATHWELPGEFRWVDRILGLPVRVGCGGPSIHGGQVGRYRSVPVEISQVGIEFFEGLPELGV